MDDSHTLFLWQVFSDPVGTHEYPEELLGSKAGIEVALKKFSVVDSLYEEKVSRPLAFVSVAGSHNYKCVVGNSDVDYKVVYLPSLEDFYYVVKSSKMDVISDAIDLSLHPIQKYRNYMLKGNINFFEVLYSQSIYLNPDLKEFWRTMKQLVEMNVANTVVASYMQSRSRFKRTMQSTPDTEFMFEAAGYNYKAASFSIRMMAFILELLNEGKFSIVPKLHHREFIMELKMGTVSHETFLTTYEHINAATIAAAFKHYNSRSNWQISAQVRDLDRALTDDYRNLNRHADDELKRVILNSLVVL